MKSFERNDAFIEDCKKLGLTINPTTKHVTMEGGIAAALAVSENIDKLSWGKPQNRAYAKGYLTDSNNSFRGGSHADLQRQIQGDIDMKPFYDRVQQFGQTVLGKKLAANVEMTSPKRSRFLSEHDGEWSYDRKWEITPFAATKRKMTPLKIVDISCLFSMSCFTSSDDINNYGATVWALIQVVEQLGMQARVTYTLEIERAAEGLNSTINITVKKPGEYIAPNLLATCFSTLFFRRLCFGLIVATAESRNKVADSNLGSPKKPARVIHYENGNLFIAPTAVQSGGVNFTKEGQEEIMKMVCGKIV